MMFEIYWKSKQNIQKFFSRNYLLIFRVFSSEKQEKNTALLKNAEISQSEERLKQELRNESHELSEVYEQLQKVQTTLQTKGKEFDELNSQIMELHGTIQKQNEQIQSIEEMRIDIIDKNKVIIFFIKQEIQKPEICIR